MSTRYFVCGIVFSLALNATAASAQTSSPQSSNESWQFQVVPYLWGSGFDGQVGIGNRSAEVDASFSNILSHLHFAAMGMADARHDKFVAMTDVLYTDLRGQNATPGPLFSSVSPQQKLFILTPEAGYRFLSTHDTSVDVVGGIRLWHMSSELQFQAGVLPASTCRAAADGLMRSSGVRARKTLPESLVGERLRRFRCRRIRFHLSDRRNRGARSS